MNKCTLLIDGNWLLRTMVSFDLDKFSIENNEATMARAKEVLKTKILDQIIFTTAKLSNVVDNIILIADYGKSWRKGLEAPSCLGAKYKANRVVTQEYDWGAIFSVLNEIGEEFKELNITTSKVYSIEGDDLCYYWSDYLNENSTNCIIWSTDNDLKQLVKYNGYAWTAWWHNKYGLFVDEALNDDNKDDISFFLENYNSSKNLFEELKIESSSVNYINPEDIVMKKIICGDKSDNILPLVYMNINGRNIGIGEKMWLKCKEDLNIKSLKDFLRKKDNIIEYFYNLKKFKDDISKNFEKKDLEEIFDYNYMLVYLNKDAYKDGIYESMDESKDYKIFDVSNISLIKGNVQDNKDEVSKLFEAIPF